MNKSFNLNGEKILTREEVLKLFDISKVTLCSWVKKGLLRQHHMGRPAYFIESEIYEDIKKCGSEIRPTHKNRIVTS